MEKKFALDFIVTEKTWSFHYKNTTADGNKSYYRCNKIKLRGHQCQAGTFDQFKKRASSVWKVTLPSDASNENGKKENALVHSSLKRTCVNT